MRQESIGSYIWTGMHLRYLLDATEGHGIHGPAYVIDNIEVFLARLEELGLTVTAKVAAQQGLPNLLDELNKTDEDAVLSQEQADSISNKLDVVQTVLRAESVEKYAFVTSPKRWDVERLLKNPGSFFGDGVFSQLAPIAAFDFEEACKCIAFELPTAAVFHIMRGTEAVLRSFYCHVVKQNRLAKKQRMWGPMVDGLRKRSKPPAKALLDNLDAIRVNFRNPTQHPDEVHTIDGAQDLLGVAIPVVNEMVGEMTDSG
ncbi:MAG TPA: hypothetical protein VFU11_00355 [Solirubrobacterales bacterium]|nr:hypothetical protein [Solirubrobacterales bacterium]